MTLKHSILFDRWFLSASLLGMLVMGLITAYGTLTIQIAMLGTLVSILAGISLTVMQELERCSLEARATLTSLGIVLPLKADPVLRESFDQFLNALQVVHSSSNPAFRTLGEERVASLSSDFRNLARQRLVYVGTEGWRTAYAEILQHSALKEYRSVAWVRSDNYWQDQPGLQSLRINCELAGRGVQVTRIIIRRTPDPAKSDGEGFHRITAWMTLQHKAGIRLLCIEEQVLLQEKDLLTDFGIYGSIAVGILDAEETSSRTLQFRLSFDPMDLDIYREKWDRLRLYATEWHPPENDQDLYCVQ